jgi:uncharacterized damage-inducible protein DinB
MRTALVFVLFASAAFAQAPAAKGPALTGLAAVLDGQITTIEREVLALARKMPADKYDFAPATGTPPAGTFDGVRTFGQQVRHIATVMYDFAARALNEQPPVSTAGPDENGPLDIKTKDQSVAYFEGALAYAHKAMRAVKADMPQQQLQAAAFIAPHTNDHYGQMVVYARLNGVTPGGGPGPVKGKAKAK